MFSIFKKKKIVPHIRLTGVIGSAGRFNKGIDLAGQREIIKNDTGISPILLMDDISSELDKDNANLMLKYLINNSIQTIMTSIENNHFFNTDGVCMFHVEQIGDLSNVR